VKFRVIPAEDPNKKAAGGAIAEQTPPRTTRREKNPRGARRLSRGWAGQENALLYEILFEWQLSHADDDIE
jgi:hypothetical protein